MFTRKRVLIGGLTAILAVAAVAAVIVWYTMFLNDSPSEVSLDTAVSSVRTVVTATGAADSANQADSLAGTWTLAQSGDSFVGYRVNEELARIGSTTAVGRTKNITATLQFDGKTITDVQITADLTTLTSDQTMRDNALKSQALETSKYPTATFKLTQPITLDSVPAEGQTISVTAVGDLTIHGVTKSVSIPLQGQLTNGYVVVVGSLTIPFADYNIAAPRSFSVLSVEDHGTMELQVVLQKASTQS
jgi:polyisoprenoid-binding protein YceI